MFSCRPYRRLPASAECGRSSRPGRKTHRLLGRLPLLTDLDIWELHEEGVCVAVDKDPRLLTADEHPLR